MLYDNAMLLAILVVNSLILLLLVLVLLVLRSIPWANIASTFCDKLSESLIVHVKNQLRASAGGVGKGESYAQTNSSPLLAGVLSMFPQARTLMKKNPELIEALISRFIKPSSTTDNAVQADLENNHNGNSNQFRLGV